MLGVVKLLNQKEIKAHQIEQKDIEEKWKARIRALAKLSPEDKIALDLDDKIPVVDRLYNIYLSSKSPMINKWYILDMLEHQALCGGYSKRFKLDEISPRQIVFLEEGGLTVDYDDNYIVISWRKSMKGNQENV